MDAGTWLMAAGFAGWLGIAVAVALMEKKTH